MRDSLGSIDTAMMKQFPSPEGQRARLAGAAPHPVDLPTLLQDLRPGFVLFIASSASDASRAEWEQVATTLLQKGLVYLVAWGPGCRDVEDHFDSAYVNAVNAEPPLVVPQNSVVMTTSHADESLEAALWYAVHAAWPDDAYAENSHSTVMVAIGNEEWHQRIETYLAAGAPLVDAA